MYAMTKSTKADYFRFLVFLPCEMSNMSSHSDTLRSKLTLLDVTEPSPSLETTLSAPGDVGDKRPLICLLCRTGTSLIVTLRPYLVTATEA